MKTKSIAIILVAFTSMALFSCKKEVCVNCYNLDMQTGAKTDIKSACDKNGNTAIKAAMMQVPADSNDVVQCGFQ
jgi:hypothetical protein